METGDPSRRVSLLGGISLLHVNRALDNRIKLIMMMKAWYNKCLILQQKVPQTTYVLAFFPLSPFITCCPFRPLNILFAASLSWKIIFNAK